MTTPTGTTYVTRARAILATISGVGTDVTAGADLVTTPGYEVFLKSARHERISGAKRRMVTRTLSIRVYHTRVEDASKEAALRVARAALEDDIEDFVDAVFNHVNLGLNDGGVVTTGDADDSIGLMPYGSNVYYGFDIDLTITYNRG